ncbi:uncharacterized protein LOC119390745 [Rhipicephalus sanguineus]|uniref:uncharacterized protein LOC119390745 n=1 Tax=Rhipicephalus sanguineus TaxID=34632 RepID=UPI001895ECBE|nr:uncharacterized protein LOC119390745 [Rhipicephalus sanguineus]
MLAYAILTCMGAMATAAPVTAQKNQPMRWCGGQLNPRDHARAMTFATSLFYSCKDEILRINFPPIAIKEIERLCAGWRICYALVDDFTNASVPYNDFLITCMKKLGAALVTVYPHTKETYNFDPEDSLDGLKRCAGHLLPRDWRYMMQAISYVKYFASG